MSVWIRNTEIGPIKIKQAALPLVASLILIFTGTNLNAQTPPRPAGTTTDKRSEDSGPLTTFEEEIRAKRMIRMAEKEHEENLKRAREILQLGQDLRECVKTKANLDRDNTKKLDRLEKLTKKIRGEAGGGDDDVQIIDVPSDISAAISLIAENAELLSKDVQNTPRQVVSASVIDRANVLLELVKIVRGLFR